MQRLLRKTQNLRHRKTSFQSNKALKFYCDKISCNEIWLSIKFAVSYFMQSNTVWKSHAQYSKRNIYFQGLREHKYKILFLKIFSLSPPVELSLSRNYGPEKRFEHNKTKLILDMLSIININDYRGFMFC